MTLNDQQIAAFHESGYLFFAGLLDEQEVRALKDAVPDVLSREGPEVVREKDDPTAARLAFGAHTYSEPFERLARLPPPDGSLSASCWETRSISTRPA